MDRTKRIMAIKADGIMLSSSERPIDYGHCNEIFKDKYGEVRGEKMYQDFINMGGNSSARFFVVAEKILKEKKAMHWFCLQHVDLRPWQDYNYDSLFDMWQMWKAAEKMGSRRREGLAS